MQGASCGVVCQHPCCWMSGRMDMINASRKLGLTMPEDAKSISESPRRQAQKSESLSNVLSHKLSAGSLPTLKVVNLLENDLDSEGDEYPASGTDDKNGYYIPFLPPSRDTSMRLSSVTSRELFKTSKFPKAPCASPSPSYSSMYLKRLRQRSKNKWKEDELKSETQSDTKQTTRSLVQLQETDFNEKEYSTPYLVWVPSKKKKKRRKCKSADCESVAKTPKVSMKHITGNDSDFGFLATPFNQESAPLRSQSRATHTVRLSPNRLYPRRLPPMPQEAPDRKRSEKASKAITARATAMQLLSDDLRDGSKFLKTAPLLPKTPRNTRMFSRPFPEPNDDNNKNQSLEEDAMKTAEEEKEPVFGAEGVEEEDEDLIVAFDGPFVIHNGKRLPESKGDCEAKCTAMADMPPPSWKREELQLPRVTLPKDKLKQLLPIENHCKNSIPSHELQGIQMQPIESMLHDDAMTSSVASGSASMLERTISDDMKYLRDSLLVEAPISNEDYTRLLSSDDMEMRHVEELKESLIYRWEASEVMPQAPAPTPASPRKSTHQQQQQQLTSHEDEIREEVADDGMRNAKEEEDTVLDHFDVNEGIVLESDATVTDEHVHREVGNLDGCHLSSSPVPSKASAADWPSDKDIMRQTYEKYRSLTPFKMQGVSLIEARLNMIKEANRDTAHEALDTILMYSVPVQKVYTNTAHEGVTMMQRNVMHPRPRPTVLRSLKATALLQQQKKENPPPPNQNVTELNVSTINPSERRLKEKNKSILSGNRISRTSLRIDRMSLIDPNGKPKHDHVVPAYEIYESKIKRHNLKLESTGDLNRDSEQVHIVIPVPNSSPCELVETISSDDVAVNTSSEKVMIINSNSMIGKIKQIDMDCLSRESRVADGHNGESVVAGSTSALVDNIHENNTSVVKSVAGQGQFGESQQTVGSINEMSIQSKDPGLADSAIDHNTKNDNDQEEKTVNLPSTDLSFELDETCAIEPGNADTRCANLNAGADCAADANNASVANADIPAHSSVDAEVNAINSATVLTDANSDINTVTIADTDTEADDDVDARMIKQSSILDYEVDSLPDLTAGLEMSLNLSLELEVKKVVMEISDNDERGQESESSEDDEN
eukprot:gene16241-17879_t